MVEPRPTCYRCFRPESLCYCRDLPRIDNKTKVVIVQHPREQFHPLNTARIVEQSLCNAVVVRASVPQLDRELAHLSVSADAALLFPSADAEDLEDFSQQTRPSTIVILDGTWSQAKNLLRDVPRLRALRRVKFSPVSPSTYRIRREPQEDYLSTVEAVSHVLFCLEPETPHLLELTRAFNRMIDRNIAARRPSEEGTRYKRGFKDTPHRFPCLLFAPLDCFLVVYCEGTSRFAKATASLAPGRMKEPLVVYLRRPGDEKITRVLLKTERQPPPRLLEHLALSRSEFLTEGVNREHAAQVLRSHLEPEGIPVVWNASSRQILNELGIDTPSTLVLKGVHCDYRTYRARRERSGPVEQWGGMEDILAAAGVPWKRPPDKGRGSERLVQTEAIFSWIRRLARDHCQGPGA